MKKKIKHVMLDGGKRKGNHEKKRKTASCWRDGNQMDCCSAFFVSFRVGVFSLQYVELVGSKFRDAVMRVFRDKARRQ
jgi:hypothetical protein